MSNGTEGDAAILNGAPAVEEDQWRKVGHAPRFGTGQTPSIKEETSLLDHQTWVEGQLDEKFFGGMLA